MTTAPDVTLVVVPRALPDGPPITREHLRQDHLPVCPDLVDGGSPAETRRYLEGQARARGFRLVRTERHLTAGFSSVMTCLRAREASAPVRAWGGSVGGVRSVSSGRATRLLSVIDLFFSASRIRPVRTRQAQARR